MPRTTKQQIMQDAISSLGRVIDVWGGRLPSTVEEVIETPLAFGVWVKASEEFEHPVLMRECDDWYIAYNPTERPDRIMAGVVHELVEFFARTNQGSMFDASQAVYHCTGEDGTSDLPHRIAKQAEDIYAHWLRQNT